MTRAGYVYKSWPITFDIEQKINITIQITGLVQAKMKDLNITDNYMFLIQIYRWNWEN